MGVVPNAFWPLNALPGGITAEDWGGYQLSSVGAPSVVAGQIGNAISFDGASDGLVSGAAAAGLSTYSGPFTWWGWIKRSRFAATEALVYVQNDASSPDAEYGVYLFGDNDNILVVSSGNTSRVTTAAIADTNWHLVVVSYNKDALTLTVTIDDGATQNFTGQKPARAGSNTRLYLAESAAGSERFQGVLDAIGFGRFVADSAVLAELWNGGTGVEYVKTFPALNHMSPPFLAQ